MNLYKYVQKGGWFHVINENNHDAMAILMNLLLNLKLSGDYYFSCIIGYINFKQWDPGGCSPVYWKSQHVWKFFFLL